MYEIIKELNIDMDNLCTFMPQDKVGNFSQLTPKGVLEKTLQCILYGQGSKTLADEQMELLNLENDKDSEAREVEAKEKAVQTLTTQVNSMREEVDRMKARNDKQLLLEVS